MTIERITYLPNQNMDYREYLVVDGREVELRYNDQSGLACNCGQPALYMDYMAHYRYCRDCLDNLPKEQPS